MVRAVGAVAERIHTARDGAGGRAARRHARPARAPDGGAEPADRCAGFALRRDRRAAGVAARARPNPSRSRRACAGWPISWQRATAPHPGRSRRGDRGRRASPRRARRAQRRAAGDLGMRPRPVCGQPVVARHLRRVRLPGRRRADRAERPDPRLRRQPDALDHQARQADRAGRTVGADRHRRGTKLGYQMPVQHAVQADARAAAEALLAELNRRGSSARQGWRDGATSKRMRAGDNHNAPFQDTSTSAVHRPAHAQQGGGRHPARAARRRLRLGPLLRLGAALPARAERARSCLSHSFQSVGLGLASAIGLGVANPGALAVLGAGDGGFLMSISDLETAVRSS